MEEQRRQYTLPPHRQQAQGKAVLPLNEDQSADSFVLPDIINSQLWLCFATLNVQCLCINLEWPEKSWEWLGFSPGTLTPWSQLKGAGRVKNKIALQ